MSSTFITSDLHFGHAFVSSLRGFSTVAEHDAAVMASLGTAMRSGGELWILGDLSTNRRGEQWALTALRELSEDTGARLHLIEGNHDSCASIHRDGWKRQRAFFEAFESVQAFARRRGPDRAPVLMSHYPYSGDHTETDRYDFARLKDTGQWLLHGHTHQVERISGPRQIHVGWDAWHRPVAWHEIEQIIVAAQT